MKILVTGGLGFVGVNIVRGLAAQAGVQIVAADRLPWDAAIDAFLAPVAAQVSHCALDVCDCAAVQEVVASQAITHIVHAAAITATDDEERARAAEIVAVNLQGSIHVLDAALAAPAVARVLLISSSGVYGAPPGAELRRQHEGDALDLSNLYAITKASAELLAARYAALSGKAMAAVRLPGIYGPLERSHASRRHTSAPGRLMAALRAGQAVRVAGPTVARDWTYTADVAAGVWALLTAAQWRHAVYNLSYGEVIPFAGVVAAFVAAGLRATWIDDPDAADIAMWPRQRRDALDITRLQQETGFRPRFPLPAGLAAWLAASPL